MHTEAGVLHEHPSRHPLASRRILRLALGTALALWFSQAIAWQLSFIAPVFTLFILGLPLPAPGFRKGLIFVFALLAPVTVGLLLVPFLDHARWAGIVLVAVAFFFTFYYTARGGSAVLGTFMSLGLTLVVTIGSVNSEVLILLIHALAINAVFGLAFVWVAHALLPDPPRDPAAPARQQAVAEPVSPMEAGRRALRSLAIVLPLVLVFLFISGSATYTIVMIKVASMGQQASADDSRAMGRSLVTSTLWGGLGAILAWYLLSAWPSLALYTLLIALAGLQYGRRIFHGAAVHRDFSTWSYAFLTMIIILAPAVLDSPGSTGAGAAFWSRFTAPRRWPCSTRSGRRPQRAPTAEEQRQDKIFSLSTSIFPLVRRGSIMAPGQQIKSDENPGGTARKVARQDYKHPLSGRRAHES
jgi:hypothetical protein